MWPPTPKIFTICIYSLALYTKYLPAPDVEYLENGENDKNGNEKII